MYNELPYTNYSNSMLYGIQIHNKYIYVCHSDEGWYLNEDYLQSILSRFYLMVYDPLPHRFTTTNYMWHINQHNNKKNIAISNCIVTSVAIKDTNRYQYTKLLPYVFIYFSCMFLLHGHISWEIQWYIIDTHFGATYPGISSHAGNKIHQ